MSFVTLIFDTLPPTITLYKINLISYIKIDTLILNMKELNLIILFDL